MGVEALQLRTLRVAGYEKKTIVGACHCTSDGQEHKLEGVLTLGHHSMQTARQPSQQVISLGSFTRAGEFGAPAHSSQSLRNELQKS